MQDLCPSCLRTTPEPFFERRRVPVFCNVLWPDREQARAATRGDILLGLCPECGLIHNTAFDPELVRYSPDYESSLHFSAEFTRWARSLAQRLVEEHGLRGREVIDIGCGKGEFLQMLMEAGAGSGLGFDESFEGQPDDPRIRVIRAAYDAEQTRHAADLICCRHVLEHVAEPRVLMQSIHRAASQRDGTVVYLEVPDAMWTLEELGIWDVIYEHCSYFTGPALWHLFAECGFAPQRMCSDYGGQFLRIEAKIGEASERPGSEDADLLDLARTFDDRYREKIERWGRELQQRFSDGQRLAVWGAGSKGVMFLNSVAGGAHVTRVVDLNRRKQGLFVPGTGQLVEAPEALAADPPDVVVVMNPIYLEEIRAACAELGFEPELRAV